MDAEPSYRKPTRASLGRVRMFVSTPPKKKIDKKQMEERQRLTKVRIESAEKLRLLVAPSLRWPTRNSVRVFREGQAKLAAKGATPSKQSSNTQPASGGSSSTTNNPSSSPSRFPFSVQNSKDLSTFPKFPVLPTELRLQIWKEALSAPKFIELQYWTNDATKTPYHYAPSVEKSQIINYQRYEPLFSVCLESREVAQSFAPKHSKLSHLKITQDSWGNVLPALNPEPVFTPERDTIFFRPMDHSLGNSLRSLPSNFRGHIVRIQHIAIPLDLKKGVSSTRWWASELVAFPKLKTLTFMLGCTEKSWTGDRSIELRDMEQWFVDGRKRTVEIDLEWPSERMWQKRNAGVVDVSELPAFVARAVPHRQLAVRVVAWKRLRSK
ncbi:uncharacterized protein LY89DRAFT_679252 [Mollisia scopiformis]|uniref:2EXR domain-containing protein n=1 Tax=Mollisia scopiformis TaxID=149040 RepID=A0A194XVF2_MOLSC|nr:uncharacterized protein LY89DRAFT_679252 [Mollisia scopiformis]KUJ23989.1 hypothetical protein LY89DRAFT_679252 [Mollisia scopiformis]